MSLLILVSLVWAFSFGLIKGRLTGLDPVAVSVVRLALAALVFLPFLRPRGLDWRLRGEFLLIGAVQFGLMYVFYLAAFRHLQAYEVALATIFTPLYVTLLHATLERTWRMTHLLAAGLAVLGAGVMLWHRAVSADALWGFALVQASNLSFAIGQLAYKRRRPAAAGASDAGLFAWLYQGALATTLILSLATTDWPAFQPTGPQWLTLAYLGILASGLAFFGWNLGALRVNVGTLAVFNNLKIPLAVASSLLFFGEQADVLKLGLSLGLLGVAVWLTERKE